jgi:hypothetical protein
MMGRGNLFLTETVFNFLKSTQNLQVLSFFLTKRTREAKGLMLGTIRPIVNIFETCLSIVSFCSGEYLYGLLLIGDTFGSKVIVWSYTLEGGKVDGS